MNETKTKRSLRASLRALPRPPKPELPAAPSLPSLPSLASLPKPKLPAMPEPRARGKRPRAGRATSDSALPTPAAAIAKATAAGASTAGATKRSRAKRKRPPVLILLRLAFVPVRVGVWMLSLGTKVGFRAGRISAKGGRAVARRAGWRNVALVAVGFALGLLVSAVPGRTLRGWVGAALRRTRESGSVGETLAEAVAHELAQSPRTWHLPQPQITAVGGVVTLRGSVAHETASDALERTARTVSGVTEVVNELTVA